MLLLTTTILQCPSELSNELISLWSKCNALRTIYRPSESISPMGFGFCFVVPAQLSNPLRVLSKTQPPGWSYGQLAMGYRILAIGDWQLAIGDWLERCAAYPCLSPLTSRLIASSSAKAVFWRRCHRQMQERYKYRESKPTPSTVGERFEERFGEHHYSTKGR